MKAPPASSVTLKWNLPELVHCSLSLFTVGLGLANIIYIVFGSKLVFNHAEVYQNSEMLLSF
jgi:hypothetical protein